MEDKDKTITDLWMDKCVKIQGLNPPELNLLISKSVNAFEEGRMLGLKMGLEVAKDVMKREGYDLTFPNPESIIVEEDSLNLKNGKVKAWTVGGCS